jgi:hypothetical protein
VNKLKIELGGKERTLKFNMLFLEEFEKKRKEKQGDVSNTACMIYAAIKANSLLTDEPMDCSFEDCFDWGEEMLLNNDISTIEKILEAYQQSTVYKATQEAIKKKELEALSTEIQPPINGQIGTRLNGTPSEKWASGLPIITI